MELFIELKDLKRKKKPTLYVLKALMGLPKPIKYVSHKVCLNVILITRQTHTRCGA